jgi:hypothetical protein
MSPSTMWDMVALPRSVAFSLIVTTFFGCAAAGRSPGQGSGNGGNGGGVGGNGDGGIPADLSTGNGGGGGSGGSGSGGDLSFNSCPDSAKLVYLLDSNNSLWSFQPNPTDITKSILTSLGPLKCATTLQPNAMAVDRTGIAWVEYVPADDTVTNQDSVFKVDVNSAALTCTATTYKTSAFGTRYGMGFVANAPMSSAETLFVATGNAPFQLGTFDISALTIATVSSLKGGPELSGTGDARLWGFYPDPTMPRVSEINKMTGAEGMSYPIPQAMGTEDGYAFAFWGGDFWVFLKKDTETSTVLYHVKGTDGSVNTWTMTGHWIIGAGVSTCAPVIIS